MTIAIFGGSFNPVHVAHQLAVLYVLETQPVSELWIVPAFAHPFGKPLAPYEHRVAMCELAAGSLGERVKVSRAEEELAKRPGFTASRTLDLLEHLAAQQPAETWRLVIGADILGETAQWHRWDDVAAKAPPIVVGRAGYAAGAGLVMPDVSATRVRALCARLTAAERAELAKPIWQQLDAVTAPELRALLPRTVLWYIARLGLYT